MSHKIVIQSGEFEFVPNDSYLINNNLTYSFINALESHLNFFLPPISGLTDTQKNMSINIFTLKSKKTTLYIFSDKSNKMDNGRQVFAEDTPDSNVIINIKNGKWSIETEKMMREN